MGRGVVGGTEGVSEGLEICGGVSEGADLERNIERGWGGRVCVRARGQILVCVCESE